MKRTLFVFFLLLKGPIAIVSYIRQTAKRITQSDLDVSKWGKREKRKRKGVAVSFFLFLFSLP